MSKRAIYGSEAAFNIAASNGVGGTAKRTERFDLVGATIHFNIGSGSYRLEASNDGTNWITIGAATITASEMRALTANYAYLRVYTITAGTCAATLHAHEFIW
jgi:hypothetical protein